MAPIWDAWQQKQLLDAASDASRATAHARAAIREAESVSQRLDAVERDNQRLVLTVIALSELLRDRFGVTEEELRARIEEIDLRDGVADGKLASPRWDCPACQRRNQPIRLACLYCGKSKPSPEFPFSTPNAEPAAE